MQKELLNRISGGLIVSCQASTGEPLARPEHILALSETVVMGGAIALRLEGIENIEAVKKSSLSVPLIGLTKIEGLSTDERLDQCFITSSFEEAQGLARAGVDIIALDATSRRRRDGLSLEETISRIHAELGLPVFADVATLAEGKSAQSFGADIVSTTLFGYTRETVSLASDEPGFELLESLCRELDIPVVLEGRVWHPHEVDRAFQIGALSVVVGSAITRPHYITERFVKQTPAFRVKEHAGVETSKEKESTSR